MNKITQAFRRTVLVKDLRIYKEREKQRRSDLIYGTTDMKTKLFERAQKERKQRRVSDAAESQKESKETIKAKKTWRERLLLHPGDRLLSTFDALMMIIIAYSCFLSAYYAAFDFPL